MEFLFDPKESIIKSEEKSISSEPILLYSNSLFHSANRNGKALHVLTAGRSEMGCICYRQ